VVKDASYAAPLFGGGLEYHVNPNWTLLTGVTAVPGRSADQQPRTVFFSGGFDYNVRHLLFQQAETVSGDSPVWTRNIIQVGYVTNALGYGANDFVSTGTVPVFWTG